MIDLVVWMDTDLHQKNFFAIVDNELIETIFPVLIFQEGV